MTIVWRGMTQEELDAAYDQAAFAPNMQDVVARFEVNSEAVRKRFGMPMRYAYGPGKNEWLDVHSHKSAIECARLTGASAAGESPAGRRRQATTSTPSHGPSSARMGVKR